MSRQPSSAAPPADLLDRVLRSAERFPDRVAIECDGADITHRQLTQLAERIRTQLAASGVRAGDGVGVLQRRSPALIASLLAILALGAHFIPLDPKQPRARLRRFTELGRPRLILCDPVHHASARQLSEALVLSEDAVEPEAPTLRAHRPPEDALGYVLFTSGSTGTPKGVEVFRSSMSTLFDSMTTRLTLGAEDVVLAHSTVGFDMSIPELFLPLTLGARMVLASSEQSGSPHRLLDLLDGVTFMQATPTTWKILLTLGLTGADQLTAVTGGEATDPVLARELLGAVGELWNFYGPTEATVWVCAQRLGPDLSHVPLGEQFADTRLSRPARGAVAELVISGSLVARGYRGGDESGAFGVDERGERSFSTGDLVREHPDGTWEWAARKDEVTKVRGNRVSLAEISSVLEELPEVRHALTLQTELMEGGEPVLIAYLVPTSGNALDFTAVAERLRATLPTYMLPDHYHELAEIPLLPSGKLDRSALPIPTRAPAQHSTCDTEMDGPLAMVLDVFRRVLDDPELAPDADFFDHGGSSALAAVVAGLLTREHGSVVEIREIHECTTARNLAGRLAHRGTGT